MKALSIRNLPDDVDKTLKAMAAANHHSMIERETRLTAAPALAAARAWQLRLTGRNLGDTVEAVRKDRARCSV
jgi:plasmid stability protein